MTTSKTHATKRSSQAKKPTRQTTQPTVSPVVSPNSNMLQRAIANPTLASSSDILRLQRLYGNRAVARLLASAASNTPLSTPVQPKLRVGPARDPYEQEADQVAEQVVQPASPADQLPVRRKVTKANRLAQRHALSTDEQEEIIEHQPEEEETIQRKSAGSAEEGGGFEASHTLEQQIAAQQGKGSSLSKETRAYMEPRFQADFDTVRIHTDAEADTLNRSLNAHAFTSGPDIFFRQGEYNPGSLQGQRLLAHELTHVVQQGQAAPQATGQPLGNSAPEHKTGKETPATIGSPEVPSLNPTPIHHVAEAAKPLQRAIFFEDETRYLDAEFYNHKLQNYDEVQNKARDLSGPIIVKEGEPKAGAAQFTPKDPMEFTEPLTPRGEREAKMWLGFNWGEIVMQPLATEKIAQEDREYYARLVHFTHETQHAIDYISEDETRIDVAPVRVAERIHSEFRAFALQTALTQEIIERANGNKKVVSDRELLDLQGFNEAGFKNGGRMFATTQSYMTLYGRKEMNDSNYSASEKDVEDFMTKHQDWVKEALDLHQKYLLSSGEANKLPAKGDAQRLKEEWDEMTYLLNMEYYKDKSGSKYGDIRDLSLFELIKNMLDLWEEVKSKNYAILMTRFKRGINDLLTYVADKTKLEAMKKDGLTDEQLNRLRAALKLPIQRTENEDDEDVEEITVE